MSSADGSGIRCGNCGAPTGVFDSRKKPGRVWRRRRCDECDAPQSTMEIPMSEFREMKRRYKEAEALRDRLQALLQTGEAE